MAILQARFFNWPEFTPATGFSMVIILLSGLIIIALISFFHKRKQKVENAWLALGHFANKQGLKRDQVKVLGVFFQELPSGEKTEISFNQKLFANRLYGFLQNHPMVNAHDRVEIFDKLIPDASAKIDVRTTEDLKQGELCSFDIGRRTFLGRVAKVKTPQVLISVKTGLTVADVGNQPCALYVYRNNLGGYLLQGKVLKISPDAAIMEHDGRIDFKGEQHIMTLINLPFILKPWPVAGMDITPKEQGAEKEEIHPEFYNCETDRISDRAILMRFTSAYNGTHVLKQEIWELQLDLPDSYQFVTHCKMIPSMTTPGFYILKFANTDESARSRLFHYISQNSPVREMIS